MNLNLLIITDNDLALLGSLQPHEQLQNELDRAIVVSSEAVPADVVTMNSHVRYVDETTGERHSVSVVYPADADAARNRISVLAPVGAALLGLSVGQTIEWRFPDGGWRRLRVEGVLRPEPGRSDGMPEASRFAFRASLPPPRSAERDFGSLESRPRGPLMQPSSGVLTRAPVTGSANAPLREGLATTHEVAAAIDSAGSVETLAHAADGIRALAKNMLAQGVGAEALTGVFATLNERLTGRILTLESARHDFGGIRLSWLGLGSEARREQTFVSDQDNAIIFDAEMPADAARARLLPFARAVNLALDACGFPLCAGEIMASNAKWCLSAAEWRARFAGWIRNAGPDALLNATIFFDFRPLWGDAALAHDLRAWLNGMMREDRRFLHMMARDTVQWAPPLGLFGGFLTSGTRAERGTIDLKKQGTRVFTDAARIYALATGAEVQNTADRLRHARNVLGGAAHETEAMIEASHFILLLRLRHQHLESRGREPGDRINPHSLNGFDQSVLKEALRQAKKLQSRLALDYQVH